MTVMNENDMLQSAGIGVDLPETQLPENPDKSTLAQSAIAGLKLSPLGAVTQRIRFAPDVPLFDEGKSTFNPYVNDGELIRGYEDVSEAFIATENEEQIQQTKDLIDAKRQAQEDLSNSSIGGYAVAIATMAVADPTILIPGVGTIKTAMKAKQVLKGATSGASFGVGAGVSREAIFQGAELDREASESIVNIMIDTAAGSLLGGITGGLTRGVSESAKRVAKENITGVLGDGDIPIRAPDSVGAARALDPEGESLVGISETTAKVLGTGFKHTMSMTLRGVTSKATNVKKMTNNLFEHNFLVGKELKGEAKKAAETTAKRSAGEWGQAMSEVDKLFAKQAGAKGILRAKVADKLGRGDGLSQAEFNEQIAKAMRRGDKHDIPEVAQAAGIMRTQLNKVSQNLKELGFLPEDIDLKTAESWLRRSYNIDAINNNTGEFRAILTRHFSRTETDVDKVSLQVDKTIDNIKGQGDDRLGMSQLTETIGSGSKFNKERVLDIPDEELEEFLSNDAIGINSAFIREANQLVAFQDALTRSGFDNFGELRIAVKDELQTSLGISAKTDKIIKEEIQLVDDMRDAFLGVVKGNNATRRNLGYLRKYQTTQKLGGVLISSLSDLAMPIMRNGITATVRDGWTPMIRNLQASKLAKDQAKDFAVGLEREMNSRIQSLIDPDFHNVSVRNTADKVFDFGVTAFGKASGLTYWNDFGKRMAGQLTGAKIIRNLRSIQGGKSVEKRTLELTRMGIEPRLHKRILGQFDKFGAEEGGSFILNPRDWADKEALEAVGNAILKTTDETIITPGIGDLPSFARNSEWGKTMFQFKSFGYAMANKVVISGVQGRNAHAVEGIMSLMLLGAMVESIKLMQRGQEVPDDPFQLAWAGMVRSGAGGILMDYVDGLGASVVGVGSSRFAGKNFISVVGGPSVGWSMDAWKAGTGLTSGVVQGDLDKKDIERAYKMLPYNNLFYLKHFTDKIWEDQ